jgi:hypothetical protein
MVGPLVIIHSEFSNIYISLRILFSILSCLDLYIEGKQYLLWNIYIDFLISNKDMSLEAKLCPAINM